MRLGAFCSWRICLVFVYTPKGFPINVPYTDSPKPSLRVYGFPLDSLCFFFFRYNTFLSISYAFIISNTVFTV